MKAFIYDHGWAGAEVYFSESRETAVKYFQEKEIENIKRKIEQHNVKKSGPIPPDWINELESFSNTKEFNNDIKEYLVEEGVTFWTDGDY